MIVVASTPAQAAAMLAADGRKWGEVVRRIQLGLDWGSPWRQAWSGVWGRQEIRGQGV